MRFRIPANQLKYYVAVFFMVSVFAFTTGIKSCRTSDGETVITRYEGNERIIPLIALLSSAAWLFLHYKRKRETKTLLERILLFGATAYSTCAFVLMGFAHASLMNGTPYFIAAILSVLLGLLIFGKIQKFENANQSR